MQTFEIHFRPYSKKVQEQALRLIKTEQPNFICRAKEQNVIAVFPDMFIDEYINDDLVTYYLPNDIVVWYQQYKEPQNDIADLFITKDKQEGFDEVFGNIVITGKMVDGQVTPLTAEQRNYLYHCLHFGTANGKNSLIAFPDSTQAKGGN